MMDRERDREREREQTTEEGKERGSKAVELQPQKHHQVIVVICTPLPYASLLTPGQARAPKREKF